MEKSKNTSNNMKTSLLAGSLIFLVAAIAEIILGAFKMYADSKELEEHWVNIIPFPPGIFPGLVVLLIGLIWIVGYFVTRKGQNANGHLSVGTIIALGFIFLFILILLIDIFNAYALGLEDYDGWTILASLRWIIFLSPIPMFFTMKYREFIFTRKKKTIMLQS
ncbi:MAG: hypothetical protein KAU62_06930 [Candidatus Heimdallarchaeota archaeon]|nr:hypothetical protein [Candidatus Heimdallarchaeota archaeon]MCG3255801.1 hypothetical protein [Candidatus Heimdallarchaeota archaeon]MCK4610874.1 hypothetical protein [Candidatus Heimdallarchaeota archaeon]